jgi:hypothetical protein
LCNAFAPDAQGKDQSTGNELRGADVLLLVYSVVSRESYAELEQLLERDDVLSVTAGVAKVVMVVATHIDLARETWEVGEGEGRQLAARLGCDFAATSAVDGYEKGVQDLFQGTLEKVVAAQDEKDRLRYDDGLIGKGGAPGPVMSRGWRAVATRLAKTFRKVSR